MKNYLKVEDRDSKFNIKTGFEFMGNKEAPSNKQSPSNTLCLYWPNKKIIIYKKYALSSVG